MKRALYRVSEFSEITSNSRGNDGYRRSKLLVIPEDHFESLTKLVSQLNVDPNDADRALIVVQTARGKSIKVKNYVGSIETDDGITLEILPKIFRGRIEASEAERKRIMLMMLRRLGETPFLRISDAHLETSGDVPLFEIFIECYVNEAIRVFSHGVRSKYKEVSTNLPHFRGRLKILDNLRQNSSNRARFFCQYAEYLPDNPHNRIVKTTMLMLRRVSTFRKTANKINAVLHHLEGVNSSVNVADDLRLSILADRLMEDYGRLMAWSEVLLRGSAFTNLAGEKPNAAMLFPMEKLFENYVTSLALKFKQDNVIVSAQDRRHFLISNHRGAARFRLVPDLVLAHESGVLRIVDTKWKIINSVDYKGNYGISSADLYQLFAYGKKYAPSARTVDLVLLYPKTPDFHKAIEPFHFESDLRLRVIPFDFELPESERLRELLDFKQIQISQFPDRSN